MKQTKTIIFLYNQLLDPLIQSNIFLYLKDIALHDKSHLISIVTFETPQLLASKDKVEKIKADLDALNIEWHPCKWRPGTSLIFKSIDFAAGLLTVFSLRLRGFNTIISLASVAGSFAYLMSVVFRMRLYLYQYEPHSEYEVDSGTYTRDSFKFKILNYLEKKSALYATVISSGTYHMMDRLKGWKVKATLVKIPSVVNEEKFKFLAHDRTEIRSKYGIAEDKTVLYYPGKFGGLYFKEETIDAFQILLEKDPRFHALVVTPNDVNEIRNYFLERNVPENRFTVTQSAFADIHKYHSSADFAIIAVPPGPSKKFVSNIKVGEYLCAGLPYLICRGVSEDDAYAENYNVGVVIDSFSKEDITKSYDGIIRILNQPPDVVRTHCRSVGEDYRGFKKLNLEFKRAFNALVNPS